MSEPEIENPFASPVFESFEADDEPDFRRPRDADLPSRWLRLGAAIIDGMILLAVSIPLTLAVTVGLLQFDLDAPTSVIKLAFKVLDVAVTLFLYTVIHGVPLRKNGQTWGKKICGIKIVSTNGAPVELSRLIGIRYFPLLVLAEIPVLNWICVIDILFIFTADKRCLHDLWADTIVVKA